MADAGKETTSAPPCLSAAHFVRKERAIADKRLLADRCGGYGVTVANASLVPLTATQNYRSNRSLPEPAAPPFSVPVKVRALSKI